MRRLRVALAVVLSACAGYALALWVHGPPATPSSPEPAVRIAALPAIQEGADSESERDEARLDEIRRWLELLREPTPGPPAPSGPHEPLEPLDAGPEFARVLSEHKDFYARLGAATALGEMQAVDAVPALIDALDDKDDLVRTAASEALHRITGQDFNFVSGLTKNERIRIQKKWRAWWRENETELRKKLKQPAK